MNPELKKRLLLFGGIGGGVVVLILIIVLIVNVVSGGKQSYDKIETTMKNAAIKYYTTNKSLLPTNDGEEISVDAVTLATAKYMKPLTKLVGKNVSCTGKVVVKKNVDEYIYIPYLDCGKTYSTIELYKKVIDNKNIVTSGDGLYQMNGEYVFRGEMVNNYVKIGDNLWRIVKVNANNQLQLILTNSKHKSLWDDRYNSEKSYTVGINDYKVSRIRAFLEELYSDETIFDANLKEKMISYNICYGKRSEDSNTNNNSIECNSILPNERMGLITISDYINASIDNSCKAPKDKTCQNYNYLATEKSNWWTLTAVTENTFRSYVITYNGEIESNQTSNNAYVRPVILLDTSTMFLKGNGTLDNPYTIK